MGLGVVERLAESYGRTQLDGTEQGGASAWTTRIGFGDVLANGFNPQYLSAPNGPNLDVGTGDFSLSIWSYRTSDDGSASGLIDALSGLDRSAAGLISILNL